MIKLCAFDMDGTLLNDNGVISEDNKKALFEISQQGVGVVLSTGRADSFVKAYANQLDLDLPVISCNGAVIRVLKTGELLYSISMSVKACLKIVDICNAYHLHFQMFGKESMFLLERDPVCDSVNQMNREAADEDIIPFTVLENPIEFLKEGRDIFRIKVDIHNMDLKAKVENEVNQIPGIGACFSESNLLECVHKTASKGNALKIVSESMGLSPEQVAAFGDNYNDLSMFEFAGLSVAMGNADEFIKSKAMFVTRTNNESGIAYAIKNHITENI